MIVSVTMEQSELIATIKEALKRKGTNPTRLARENGWSVNAVRYILEGRLPSSQRLAQVCKALDLEFYVGPPRFVGDTPLDVEQLASELERLTFQTRRLIARQRQERTRLDQKVVESDAFISAPLYEVLGAAGGGSPVDSEIVLDYLAFNRTWVRDQQLMGEQLAVIEVQGDSMEPTLHSGDIVLLDLQAQQLRDGTIYTLRKDGDLLVKRLRQQGTEWLIHSDNPAYPPEVLDREVAVVGRVVWLGRTL